MALKLSNNTLKGVFSDGVTRRISFLHVGHCSGGHSYECRAKIGKTRCQVPVLTIGACSLDIRPRLTPPG